MMLARALPPGSSRSALAFAVAGMVASVGVVLAGGRVGPVRGTTPVSYWFGLLSPVPVQPADNPVPGLLLVGFIAALGAVWVLAVRRCPSWSIRQLWGMSACWLAPLALGPPLLSDDLASYVAQGQLSLRDLSPYLNVPADLGAGPTLAAVDPLWRNVHSPYGPVITLIEHIAAYASGGSPLGSAVLLRLVGLASIVAVGLLASQLAPPHWRRSALLLTVLNPLLLLHVGSAGHLDAIVCALALACMLAVQRGNLMLALVLACTAGLTKAPGFAVLAVVLVLIWHGTASARRGPLVARALAVVAVTTLGVSALVTDGWGWLVQLGTPTLGFTPDAPATALALALHPVLVWTHVMTASSVAFACRVIMMSIGAVLIGKLLRTVRRREPIQTVGLILLAVAVLSPVIYPWYLLWGVSCLAVCAGERLRWLLVALSFVGSLMAVQGLTNMGIAVLACVLFLIAASTTIWYSRGRRQPSRQAQRVLVAA